MGRPYTPDWYQTHKADCADYQRRYHQRHPWMGIYSGVKSRCNNPKHKAYEYYGAQGIKCLLTQADIEMLWKRDRADLLREPSIDRIDPYGHYSVENCRFIELRVNSARQIRVFKRATKRYYNPSLGAQP